MHRCSNSSPGTPNRTPFLPLKTSRTFTLLSGFPSYTVASGSLSPACEGTGDKLRAHGSTI